MNVGNEPYPYIYRHDWEPQIANLNTLGDTLPVIYTAIPVYIVIYTAHRLGLPATDFITHSLQTVFCVHVFSSTKVALVIVPQQKSLGVTSCTSYKVPLSSFNHGYNSMFRACNMLQPQLLNLCSAVYGG